MVGRAEHGTITHAIGEAAGGFATLFLFDADGKLKSTVSFDEDKETRMAKLKKLLAG